jgi:hypothetical protein
MALSEFMFSTSTTNYQLAPSFWVLRYFFSNPIRSCGR